MIPIRTLVTGRFWMMLAWMVVLLAGSAIAQDGKKLFDPAHSIALYQSSEHFSEVMERLGDGRLSPNFVTDTWNGYTVMHSVAPAGLELLRMAVAKGGDCAVTDNFGETPLHFAASQNTFGPGPHSIRVLVDCGADVNAQSSRGATPLHAVYLGGWGREPSGKSFANTADLGYGGARQDIIQALLDRGADPNIRDKEQDTPLLIVLRPHVDWRGNFARQSVPLTDKPSHVRQLLGGGADPNMYDGEGATPLTIILQSSSNSMSYDDIPTEIISILIDYGADPNLRDSDGDTPLIVAAMHKDDILNETETLLAGGADPCLPDSEGKLPYDLAKKGSRVKRLLFEAGGYLDENLGTCARDAHMLVEAENNLNLSQNDRKRIQSCLKRQGFDPGAPDGLFGPRTRKALREWQVSQGSTGIESAGYLISSQSETLLEACKVALVPLCVDPPREACWMETANQPGCHVWNPNPQPDETVEWSGGCDSDGKASGKGRSTWRFRDDGTLTETWAEEERHEGRRIDSHIVIGFKDKTVWEGPKVGGEWHGLVVRRGTGGGEYVCLRNGETVDESRCVEPADGRKMQTLRSANLRSGPGKDYERLGTLSPEVQVAVTGDAGDWFRIDTMSGDTGFVRVSLLKEADDSSEFMAHSKEDLQQWIVDNLTFNDSSWSSYEKFEQKISFDGDVMVISEFTRSKEKSSGWAMDLTIVQKLNLQDVVSFDFPEEYESIDSLTEAVSSPQTDTEEIGFVEAQHRRTNDKILYTRCGGTEHRYVHSYEEEICRVITIGLLVSCRVDSDCAEFSEERFWPSDSDSERDRGFGDGVRVPFRMLTSGDSNDWDWSSWNADKMFQKTLVVLNRLIELSGGKTQFSDAQ